MPPLRKFKKEDIIQTAYEIVKEEGMESINSRRIAKELNCSVQPIFHNFSTMEELYQAIYEKIAQTYQTYMMKALDSVTPYKSFGLSYIAFAKQYPEFFRILFMQKTDLKADNYIMADKISDTIIKSGQNFTGLSYEEQKKFHIKVWIFTHGIACLVATHTVQFDEEEINHILSSTVKELLDACQKQAREEKN